MILSSLPPLCSIERQRLEKKFINEHKFDTKEDLIYYVRTSAKDLGSVPTKEDVIGSAYLRTRLGPWPRVLELAGLKTATKVRGEFDPNKVRNSRPRYATGGKRDLSKEILGNQRKARDEYYARKAAEK